MKFSFNGASYFNTLTFQFPKPTPSKGFSRINQNDIFQVVSRAFVEDSPGLMEVRRSIKPVFCFNTGSRIVGYKNLCTSENSINATAKDPVKRSTFLYDSFVFTEKRRIIKKIAVATNKRIKPR